ncbi:MAG: zinc-ribbon domain-containing protein [Chloroflexi bacterium]|nr:zinc-ribbon domain-containing protein [Chloroflexota bacterium]
MNAGEQRYCEQCGAALGPDARFCGKCGRPVAPAAPPPPPQASAPTDSRAQAQACAVAEAMPKKTRTPVLGRVLAVLAGLALIFLGLRGPILSIFGESATAVITDVSVSDSEEHEYQITYQFTANGQPYAGSWNQEALNITTLPAEGARISVRYLPAWPGLNAPAREAAPGLTSLVLVGLGVLLILFNGKVRIG